METPHAKLKLWLLGPLRVEYQGEPVTAFKSNKVRALLAYLAVERQQRHSREVLAALLWPDSSTSAGLTLLRDVLSNLRLVLGDRDADTPYIAVVGDTLQFQPHDAAWLDIEAFAALTGPNSDQAALERAIDLYAGDFLEGTSLAEGLDFEAWLLLQRETYCRMMQETLYRWVTHNLQAGDYAAAQAGARRQLMLDPYAEEAHRQLLRALALDGQRNQALAHYAGYRDLLAEELNVKPDVRTATLHRRIRDNQLSSRPAASVVSPDGSLFVGRDVELGRLEEGLRQAQAGKGQVILVSGEAGSGKTALVEAFIHRIVAGAVNTAAAWGACNAQIGEGDPYLPFREILRELTGDFDVPSLGGNLAPVLAQHLEALAPDTIDALQKVGPDLIGTLLPAGDRFASPATNRSGRAPPVPAAICDQVVRVLRAVVCRRTLALVLDDLHWGDGSTLNLLAHLGRQLQGSRILLIAIYRPAEAASDLTAVIHELKRRWGDIVIDLDRAAGRDFVDAILDSAPNALDAAFRDQLYRQTGGHALFTVALIEQLQDAGVMRRDAAGEWVAGDDLDWQRVPPRVEAVIAERLARLPEDLRRMLTVASVEGEIFTADVVSQALGFATDAVEQMLGGPLSRSYHLVDAQGIERLADRRVARYRFRHILFQQYLYAGLNPVERARWHEAVGVALESLHGAHPGAAARLAYHFEAAGLAERAVIYLARAGGHAHRISAPVEAIALYRRGLALLADLPESEARARLELELQMGLEAPLFATEGWGAPERLTALDRAYTLARQLGDTARILPILRALADVNMAQANHRQALAYAERLLTLARSADNRVYEALGYRIAGTARFFLGQLCTARAYLEEGMASYEALVQTSPESDLALGVEETAFLEAWLPHILLALGYPEQAMASGREALACVYPNGPAHAQAKVLTSIGAAFHAACRQPEATLHYAQELMALARKYDLEAFEGWATFYRGWGKAALGELEAGLAQMDVGWEQLRATGTRASLANLFTLLAESHLRAGKRQRSAEVLAEAIRLVEETGGRFYLAEMHRLKGERWIEDEERAEAWFLRAIEVAQAQEAKLWELRASVSLARLYQAQRRSNEACARLSTVYGWFTEGFDMPDLVAARRVLEALSPSLSDGIARVVE